MTVYEAIDTIKKDKEWTDENLNILSEAVAEADFSGYTDPELRAFMNFINEWPYHSRVQEIVTSIMIRFMEKGVESPCGSQCGSCAFHDLEFGNG